MDEYSSYVTPFLISTHHMIKNESKDVLSFSCTGTHFSSIACTRNGVMSMFVILLSILFVARIVTLYRSRFLYYHQILIFFLAIIECLVITVHWLYKHTIQVEAIVQYLMLMQILIICHFYLSRVTRLVRKGYLKVIIFSGLICLFLYFTAVVIAIVVEASVKSTTTCTSCFDPFWLMLSIMECILVQVFLVCGVYITKKMNDVVTLDSARRYHKVHLWSIIMAFELSSITSVVYDAIMFSSYDRINIRSCSDVFNADEKIYSVVYVFLMIFEVFIPLVTLLVVFHPVDRSNQEEGPLLATSNFHTFPPMTPPERRRYYLGRRSSDILSPIQSSIQVPAKAHSYRKTQSYPSLPIIHEEGESQPLSA